MHRASAKLSPDVSSYLSVVIWIQVWAPGEVSAWHAVLQENYLSTVYRQLRWDGVMSAGSQAHSRFKVSVQIWAEPHFYMGICLKENNISKKYAFLYKYSNPNTVIHYEKKVTNQECDQRRKTSCVKEITLSSKSSAIAAVVTDDSCLVHGIFQVLPQDPWVSAASCTGWSLGLCLCCKILWVRYSNDAGASYYMNIFPQAPFPV